MSMRKHGTGEVLLDDEDKESIEKTASTETKEESLTEVRKEQQQEDEREK